MTTTVAPDVEAVALRVAGEALNHHLRDRLTLRRLEAEKHEVTGAQMRAQIELELAQAQVLALETKHAKALHDCAARRGYSADEKPSSRSLIGAFGYPVDLAGAHGALANEAARMETATHRLSGIVEARDRLAGSQGFLLCIEYTEAPALAQVIAERAVALVGGVLEMGRREVDQWKRNRALAPNAAPTDPNLMERSIWGTAVGRIQDSHGEAVAKVLRHLLCSEGVNLG